jgi:uncharacterized protein YraI
MKTKLVLFITLVATLLASCAPSTATPTPPPIPIEEPGITVTGVTVLQSVEIQIVETQPLQVNAVVRGQPPDGGCTTISSVNQVRDGNTFNVSLTTTTDPLAVCTLAVSPFEHVLALDVRDLPPAEYRVNINGVEASFELLTRDVSRFNQAVVNALNARDYSLLKLMMDDSFTIGYWLSEGTSQTPDVAIEQLQRSLLHPTFPITADFSKNLIELLGTDPVTIVDPEIQEVSPLFTSGWGAQGKDEVILFTAKLPDGGLYWYGLLFAKDGFAKPDPILVPPTVDMNAYPTSVKYVMALQDVNIRTGPGTQFSIISYLADGQTAKVTGVSADGKWWRVICPDNSVGSCWVSAARYLTKPSDGIVITPPPNIIGTADVQSVEIRIVQNDPLQVDVIARGQLPDAGCTKIWDASQERNGNTFYVRLRTKTDPQALCALMLTPFDDVIPLDVGGLQPGSYIVNVNGVEKSFELPDSVFPTDVDYVIARQEVPIYSGPGTQFRIIGYVTAGQIAKVTGVDRNGSWWRVLCPDNSTGSCWVSASPDLTTPTGLPGTADVQNVEIQILESYPLQVNAIARGFLPDAGCTTISGVSQTRNGNVFTVTISTKVDPQALCAQMLTPFEYVVPLEVGSLLAGTYIVRVNGVEASFQLPEPILPPNAQ